MDAPSHQSQRPILRSERDWRVWYAYILALADEQGVKQYIDPAVEYKGEPVEPVKPVVTDVRSNVVTPEETNAEGQVVRAGNVRPPLFSDLTPEERSHFHWLVQDYQEEKKEFNSRVKAIAKLKTRIIETVDSTHFVYTQGPTTHAAMLRLQQRFKPTDFTRAAELREQWDSLSRTTIVVNFPEWLQKWETTYDECLELEMAEVQKDWPADTFLRCLQRIAPAFANQREYERVKGEKIDFKSTLYMFRDWNRNTKPVEPRRSKNPVYLVDSSSHTPTLPNPTLQNKDKDHKQTHNTTCLCGADHRWSRCPYLFEWNRKADFKADVTIQKAIDKKREDRPNINKTLGNIRRTRKYYQSQQDRNYSQQDRDSESSLSQGPPIAAVAMDQVHLVLRDSFILDSGATNHVCNDRRRFVDFKLAGREDFLVAGNSTVVVQGYGTVEVTLDCKVTNQLQLASGSSCLRTRHISPHLRRI